MSEIVQESPQENMPDQSSNVLEQSRLGSFTSKSLTTEPCKGNLSKRFYIVTMLFLAFMLLTAVFVGYFEHQKTIGLTKQKQELVLFLDETKRNIAQQQKDILALQNVVQQNNARANPGFIVLNSVYQLLNIANTILQEGENNEQALALVVKAQKQIAGFPEFLSINKAVSEDIATLQNVTQPFKGELLLQIKTIAKQIEALNQEYMFAQQKTDSVLTNQQQFAKDSWTASHWRYVLKHVIASLQNFIIISKKAPTISLTFEQLRSLKLNLQIQLAESEWAIIHDQPDLYKAILQQISAELLSYFANNAVVNHDVIPALQKLQQKTIPSSMNVSHSLSAIESILLRPTNDSVASEQKGAFKLN